MARGERDYVFRPTRETARAAVNAHALGKSGRRLDITTEYMPHPDSTTNLGAVQDNIGTRVLRVIEFLRQTDAAKSINGYTLMTPYQRFVPAVQERLEHQLSLDKERPAYDLFFEQLGQDFYHWLTASAERRSALGAVIEPDIGIFITCTRLPYQPSRRRQ